jgi:F-type H+-transporting ATPase subunit gamma
MPSLKDIRRRIGSVKKTQQITRAMRMVAAAKLRRAQDAIESARPYAERMRETLVEVAASQGGLAEHPLLATRESVRKVDFLIITSDRGLCGAFNANVLKRAEAEVATLSASVESVSLLLVGRKGIEFFNRRRGKQVVRTHPGVSRVDYSHAVAVADFVSQRFLAGEADEVVLVHSEFVSTMTQRPRVVRLLPLAPDDSGDSTAAAVPFTIEPNAEALLKLLVPKALQVELFRALLESQAGEHAARMTSMESATRNTEDMISRLTLQYNRARQAAITKELMEIVSGAEALR